MKKNLQQPAFILAMALLMFASCKKQSDPVITLNGETEMTIYLGEAFNDPGATAKDYKGKDITSEIQVLGSVAATSGHTTLDYTVSDKKGNFSRIGRGITRGFKNSDIAGTYSVVQTSNNGGGTQNYTGTVTIVSGDIVSVKMNNMNSLYAPVNMSANIYGNATQFSIPDQTANGSTITLGTYGDVSNSSGPIKITVSFQTFNGTMTRNHDAIWTKL